MSKRIRVDTFIKGGFRHLEHEEEGVSGKLRRQLSDEEQDLYYQIRRGGWQLIEDEEDE